MKYKFFIFLFTCTYATSVLAQYNPDVSEESLQDLINMHGNMPYQLLLIDRLDTDDSSPSTQTIDGFYYWGNDERKYWIDFEMDEEQETSNHQVSLSRSHPINQFWDLKYGLSHQSDNDGSFMIGLHGLAPYWFEVDAKLLLGGNESLSGSLEIEYDLLLTQRSIIQPSIELHYDGDQVESDIGLSYRFEIIRELAPYVRLSRYDHGLGWDSKISIGLRIWK
jgi:copper resistance protein B